MSHTSDDAARAVFAGWGADTEAAIARRATIPISVHCWQGDDAVGFETNTGTSGGGIQATGNHPDCARKPDELRADLAFAYANMPGSHRLNLNACDLDTDETPDRDEIEFRHFAPWGDWAEDRGIELDPNPNLFAHAKADDILTPSHPDKGIRDFRIEHRICTRDTTARMGQGMESAAVNSIWVPDGSKDLPVDRRAARQWLEAARDEMTAKTHDMAHMRDAVDSKLFGIGVEAMTVSSHEIYLGYAIRNKTLLCFDMGHFHPSENIADKLSAVAMFIDELLLHVAHPIRWDSDRVILANDDIFQMAQDLAFADLLGRTHIGLDFFDTKISRTAAWAIRTRNMQKALLGTRLLARNQLKEAEEKRDDTTCLVRTEELKDLPFASVRANFCARLDAPVGRTLITVLNIYQASVATRQ